MTDEAETEKVTVAIRFVVTYGRVYLNQKKYLALKIFTTDESVAKQLVEVFRGKYYPQGKGFVWALGYRQDIRRCAEMVRPHRALYDHLDLLYERLDVGVSKKKPPS
jgi:hypothetical protein